MLAPFAFLLAAQGPDSGDAALARMAAAMKGHRAVSFVVTGGIGGREETMRLRFLAPNLYAVEGGRYEEHSDGTTAYNVNVEDRSYSRLNPANELRSIAGFPGYGLVFPDAPKTLATGPARTERLDERDATAVPIANPSGSPSDLVGTLLLDPATSLPVALRTERAGKPYETYRIRSLQLDPPLTPKDFAYSPPSGYRDANANVPPPAAVPDGVKPAPKGGVAYAVFRARPGLWTGPGANRGLRLDPKPKSVGEDWTFTVETKDADPFDWPRTKAHVEVGPYAASARRVAYDPQARRLTVVVPRPKGVALPEVLALELSRKDGATGQEYRFDLRPTKAK